MVSRRRLLLLLITDQYYHQTVALSGTLLEKI